MKSWSHWNHSEFYLVIGKVKISLYVDADSATFILDPVINVPPKLYEFQNAVIEVKIRLLITNWRHSTQEVSKSDPSCAPCPHFLGEFLRLRPERDGNPRGVWGVCSLLPAWHRAVTPFPGPSSLCLVCQRQPVLVWLLSSPRYHLQLFVLCLLLVVCWNNVIVPPASRRSFARAFLDF